MTGAYVVKENQTVGERHYDYARRNYQVNKEDASFITPSHLQKAITKEERFDKESCL
jgi:hypothetical protein